MRGIPIFTFINKLDRHGREPLELIDEIEKVLGIPCAPVNWPIGIGAGVPRRLRPRAPARCCASSARPAASAWRRRGPCGLDDPTLREGLGETRLRGAAATRSSCSRSAGDAVRPRASSWPAQLTPVFFGSAMTNFGVEPFLDRFVELAPPPASARRAPTGSIEPDSNRLHRLRLQDPGEHGSRAPRPHRVRARLLGQVHARAWR